MAFGRMEQTSDHFNQVGQPEALDRGAATTELSVIARSIFQHAGTILRQLIESQGAQKVINSRIRWLTGGEGVGQNSSYHHL
jgi:hypothetical protein